MGSAGWSAAVAPSTSSNELERIRALVATYFPVYDTRVLPQSVLFLVHADADSLEPRFDRLRQEMWPLYYVPILRRETGEYYIEVLRRPPSRPPRPWINVLLLILTAASTTAAGAIIWLAFTGGTTLTAVDFAYGAVTFALPLMVILGGHELAHFALARRHHVEASLPYFIPVPPPFLIFGTFGAFISLRQPIPDKRALIDIGASGPLAGFAIAVPVAIGGLFLSVHSAIPPPTACGPTILGISYGHLTYGVSALWAFLGLFFPIALVNLHPVALAGWVGILVTAINLLPAGQLDGGHVFRALLGERARYVSYIAAAALFAMGFFYPGWFIFALLVIVLGLRHPPPLNDVTPLDGRRLAIGGIAVAVLLSGFVLIPLATPTGAFSLQAPSWSPTEPSGGNAFAANASFAVVNRDTIDRAYAISGFIEGAAVTTNGVPAPLPIGPFGSYANNSSWVITWPGGPRLFFNATPAFATSSSEYLEIPSGAFSYVNVTYENPMAATVTFQVEVTEFCSNGAGPQTLSFTVG